MMSKEETYLKWLVIPIRFGNSSSLGRIFPGLKRRDTIRLGMGALGVRCSHSRQVSLLLDGEQGWQECKKDKFENKFVKKAAVSQFKKIDTAAPGGE